MDAAQLVECLSSTKPESDPKHRRKPWVVAYSCKLSTQDPGVKVILKYTSILRPSLSSMRPRLQNKSSLCVLCTSSYRSHVTSKYLTSGRRDGRWTFCFVQFYTLSWKIPVWLVTILLDSVCLKTHSCIHHLALWLWQVLFFFFAIIWDRILLWSIGCPVSCYVD